MGFEMEVGQVYKLKPVKFGGSYYILLDATIKEYLGIDELTEDTSLACKAENSKKFGHYIGLGQDKK